MDTTLLLKRAVVWGVSFALGLLVTLGIVFGPMSTTIDTYSIKYFVLTWIPIGMIFVVWADVIMGTKILPD